MIAKQPMTVYTNSIHGGTAMNVKVREVGNSLTLTIPKTIANQTNIQKNDSMKVYVENDAIVFSKASNAKNDLERYLERFYNKPIDDIGIVNEGEGEVNWGPDVGGEIIE